MANDGMYPGKYLLLILTLIFCPLKASCTKGYCFTTYRNGKFVSEGDCMSESEQNAIIKDLRAKLEKSQMERTASITPAMNDESNMAANPTTNEESVTAAHVTMNEETTTATHATTNKESTTATSPTINKESTSASSPRTTGGTDPSCQDACIPSSISDDQFVMRKGNTRRKVDGRCRCRIGIQHRVNSNLSFARNLTEYQRGFSDQSNFWLGLDRIYALTNRTGGVTMQIITLRNNSNNKNNRTKMKLNARGVHVAAGSGNYRLTMLDTRYKAMRKMNGSTFEVKNIKADGCKGDSGWWFGDISGGPMDDKWCNPNGPYLEGIKWKNDKGTSSGVGNAIYYSIRMYLVWIEP